MQEGSTVNYKLQFKPHASGLIVRMGTQSAIPVRDWTMHSGHYSGVGTMIRLRDDGCAVEQGGGAHLLVNWPSVAGLSAEELRYSGLPDAAPFLLEITTSGTIADPDFDIYYGFMTDGRRVVGFERMEAWLHVGGIEYILLDPVYAIVTAIDEFRHGTEGGIESRMLKWGKISELLPKDALVDEHLRRLNILVASSFEIDPFTNDSGEPDFDPVVGRIESRTTEKGEREHFFSKGLPAARQSMFSRRFRGLSKVKRRYAAGAGVFVMLSPHVERALEVVKRAQSGSATERRRFFKNASGYIREAFEIEEHDDTVDIDKVFSDEGLSDRIEGIGIWVKKVLPWIVHGGNPWLPPEEFGLRIGEHTLPLRADELPKLLDEVTAAVKRGDPTVRVRDAYEISADEDTISALEVLIERLEPDVPPDPDGDKTEDDTDDDEQDQVLLIKDNLDEVQFRLERKKRKPSIYEAVPALRSTPYEHQDVAINWLKDHWDGGSSGALLADDMGLGKTLEALAFLACVKEHSAKKLLSRPILVVAPTGLLKNWLDEHAKHLSGDGLGRALEAHGRGLHVLRDVGPSGSRSSNAIQTLRYLERKRLEKAPWVLTTYETLRDYQHSFARVRWRVGVFDEAQKIKNPSARVTDAVLAMNIDFAVMMTGTPVENRPSDIWSILDRAEPGVFNSLKEFSRTYEQEGEEGVQALANLNKQLTEGESESPTDKKSPPLMLRRLKQDHLSGLPEKCVHRRVVDMPSRQAEAYSIAVLRRGQGEQILRTLHKLRSVSLHPEAPGRLDVDEYIQESARLSETFKILEPIAARGEKALIFVESLVMQDFLIVALRRRFRLAEDVLVINGSVAGKKRKDRVDIFQEREGFDAMVLSPRAGGVGLTLTAANHVIHLSRWWNPAVEDQCTDRVFRIGQDRPVHVYLPMARHPEIGDYSFDLRLDSLIERKREMNRQVLAPSAASKDEVRNLYRDTVMNIPSQ